MFRPQEGHRQGDVLKDIEVLKMMSKYICAVNTTLPVTILEKNFYNTNRLTNILQF